MNKQDTKQQMYTITCTGEQMNVIAAAVEDWHRFLVGQCDMNYATSYLDNRKAMQGNLRQLEGFVPHSDWCGSGIGNEYHRKAIAQSYGIYRQILHYFATQYPSRDFNVYNYETPTCEDNMPLIKIEKKKKPQVKGQMEML